MTPGDIEMDRTTLLTVPRGPQHIHNLQLLSFPVRAISPELSLPTEQLSLSPRSPFVPCSLYLCRTGRPYVTAAHSLSRVLTPRVRSSHGSFVVKCCTQKRRLHPAHLNARAARLALSPARARRCVFAEFSSNEVLPESEPTVNFSSSTIIFPLKAKFMLERQDTLKL